MSNNNAKSSAIAAQQRDEAALRRKAQDPDLTWQAIADEFGYASKGAAFKQVMKLHRNAQKDASDEFREQWDAQFAFALDECRIILDGTYPIPEFLEEDDTINAIVEAVKRDGKLKLEAIDRLMKINERMARMHGYDAPTKTEITGAAGFPISVDPDLLPPQAVKALQEEAAAAEAEARGA